ncbi:MAG: YbhB/YbcL family Raf kinase inhibitor-like protein [Candidatus Omnitrophota bacterium]
MKRKLFSFVVYGLISLFLGLVWAQGADEMTGQMQEAGMMKLTSKEFQHNGLIPKKFTCQGSDVNPSLTIENVPAKTKTLVLIVDDPDAPRGTWVHWVAFNIPVITQIQENSIPGVQGYNDFGRVNYGGPCPPSGTHRYFFKLYALSSELELEEGATKEEVEKAMAGRILDQAELIGLYKKY